MNRHIACAVAYLLAGGASLAEGLPAAEAWPSQAQWKGPHFEYVYDLTAIKRGEISPDAMAEWGDEAVSAFLKALPTRVTVKVDPTAAALSLEAPGGLAQGPASPSFSVSPERGHFADDFGKQGPSGFVAPLHPEASKVLPSLDLVLWKVRSVELSALAALELGIEGGTLGLPMGRRQFWNKVMERAQSRYDSLLGPGREGAAVLIARLAAADCSPNERVAGAFAKQAELKSAVESELSAFSHLRSTMFGAPWNWGPELRCVQLREAVLGQPLPDTRQGTAAFLTLVAILEEDSVLAQAHAAMGALRDELRGRPVDEGWETHRAALGELRAGEALADTGAFLARLSSATGGQTSPPPLWPTGESDSNRFLKSLSGPERANAGQELLLAFQEGRIPIGSPTHWASGREFWLASLVQPEKLEWLQASTSYRERLHTLFHSARGGHGTVSDHEDIDASEPVTTRSALQVALRVPPWVQVEPLPAVYDAVHDSLSQLSGLLERYPKAAAVKGWSLDGARRATTVGQDVTQLALLLQGLRGLSTRAAGAPPKDAQAEKVARSFLQQWRSDPDARKDVRSLEPPVAGEVWSARTGVKLRRLDIRYESAPQVEVQGGGPFVVDATAHQRYLVPVLVTVPAVIERRSGMDQRAFRSLCEQAERQPELIGGALQEALSQPSSP